MSYIVMDSTFRPSDFPNPAFYSIPFNKSENWTISGSKFTSHDQIQVKISLVSLILPFNSSFLDEPCLYVDFWTTPRNTSKSINTIGNTLFNVKFVATLDKIQNGGANTPAWLHYISKMEINTTIYPQHEVNFSLRHSDNSLVEKEELNEEIRAVFKLEI